MITILDLDVISYDTFIENRVEAVAQLNDALYNKGIVAIKGIPGLEEKAIRYINAWRAFCALEESAKDAYAPDRSKNEQFLGYEQGKEKFQRPDGSWVIDDLKTSYYGFVPDSSANKWPHELDLSTPFEELGMLMAEMGKAVMQAIGLLAPHTTINMDGIPQVGRMLYYNTRNEASSDNPYWCGAHFDHGLFTTLLPAFYFSQKQEVEEPLEAGLFVKTHADGQFKKVVATDKDMLLFQVGEFAQLATNDQIRATEHRVHKPATPLERYTLALFYDAPKETTLQSTSILTEDPRYGAEAGESCTYQHWSEQSFLRYLVPN